MLKRGVTKQVVVKRALKRVTSQELSSDLIEILHLKTGLEDEKILKRHAAFLGLKIFCALQFLSIQIYMKFFGSPVNDRKKVGQSPTAAHRA